MAKKKVVESAEHGIVEVHLKSWEDFAEYINKEFRDFRDYVYRGQSYTWPLESRLDRALKDVRTEVRPWMRAKQLESFKTASRGRRGANPVRIETDNDWWALGQHNGLITPLLDWTEAPFVALFFAFKDTQKQSQTTNRLVVALAEGVIERKCSELKFLHELEMIEYRKMHGKTAGLSELHKALLGGQIDATSDAAPPPPERPSIVEFIRPMTDENPRLVNQRGLFVRGEDGLPIEEWVRRNYQKDDGSYILTRILIPDKGREDCLTFLNRMNINHLSLFPDLYGSTEYCNMQLKIPNY